MPKGKKVPRNSKSRIYRARTDRPPPKIKHDGGGDIWQYLRAAENVPWKVNLQQTRKSDGTTQ